MDACTVSKLEVGKLMIPSLFKLGEGVSFWEKKHKLYRNLGGKMGLHLLAAAVYHSFLFL